MKRVKFTEGELEEMENDLGMLRDLVSGGEDKERILDQIDSITAALTKKKEGGTYTTFQAGADMHLLRRQMEDSRKLEDLRG